MWRCWLWLENEKRIEYVAVAAESYANARHLKDTNWQMTMTWTEPATERESEWQKNVVFEDKIHRAMRWKLTKCLSSLLTNDIKRKRASEHRPFSSIKEPRRFRRKREQKITFRMHVITRQFFSLRHRQRCGTRNQDPEFVAVMARVVMLIFHLKLWHLTMVTDDDDREREKKHRINRKFNYYILWVSAGSHRHPTSN